MRRLTSDIISLGSIELEELEGWRMDGYTKGRKDALDQRYRKFRENTDNSTREDDQKWQNIQCQLLKKIDKDTKCLSAQKDFSQFLDLGCCPGGFSNFILKRFPKVTGVGVSLGLESGGIDLSISDAFMKRYEMHWGDLTFSDVCLPAQRDPPPNGNNTITQFFCQTKCFQVVLLDGHHRRPQESALTHKWDIHRLRISQLIIALNALDLGGTLIFSLNIVESVDTAQILYMLDKLSSKLITFKKHEKNIPHATSNMFYAIATGVGLGPNRHLLSDYLKRLKELWWEITYGGTEGEGRWMIETDLDFIISEETLIKSYLPRLIELGRIPWAAQASGLANVFYKTDKACAKRDERSRRDAGRHVVPYALTY